MDEITPDFIARMATRIYNERPHGNGHAPTAAHMPKGAGDVGTVPAPPSDFGQHVPFPSAVVNHAPPHPIVAHSTLPGGTPPKSFTSGALPPGVATPGSVASPFGTAHSLAGLAPHSENFSLPTLPGIGAVPGSGALHGMHLPPDVSSFAKSPGVTSPGHPGYSSTQSPAFPGLTAFVQSLRQPHHRHESGPAVGHSVREMPLARERSPGSVLLPPIGSRPFDVAAIREDFPILRQKVHGKPLAWLDNAATTQKPQSVIDAISRFYENDSSNIHRGAHTLAARATDAYEQSRQKVQAFLGASSVNEIVFVRGTTEGINLVAQTYGRKFLQAGDEIVLSQLEHHASIVPWQMIAKEKGAVLRVIPVNDRGEIILEEYQKLLGPRTKVVALTQASNSLGTILPVGEMTQIAKRYGARVIIDGAQSVAHIPVDVQQLGCDFFVFSGHKIFGPTGIGAVYIKEELHDILPPWQGGGNMIRNVTFEETSFHGAPARFEAGTPNIADAVGLGTALDYVNQLGLANIAAYEHSLLEYATERLLGINGLRLIGTAREKVGVLSFVLPNKSTEDVGRLLDQEGLAVRAGHHCSQPSLRRFGLETTVRPSLSIYNTKGEVDRLHDALKNMQAQL